jgi:hypothetical protein
MRPFDVAMPRPFDARNLPNLFPDLDSLAVEFSTVACKNLVEEWKQDGLSDEAVQQNAMAIGLMMPFWRVGYLLELYKRGWLRAIRNCDRSPGGELATLLNQWHKPEHTMDKQSVRSPIFAPLPLALHFGYMPTPPSTARHLPLTYKSALPTLIRTEASSHEDA